MTEQQAVKASIEHWKRMIAWVKKQPGKEACRGVEMEMAIGENWWGRHCPLCIKYHNGDNCGICPLYKKYGHCGKIGIKNAWFLVEMSLSWSIWLKNAKKMLRQLKSLVKKDAP